MHGYFRLYVSVSHTYFRGDYFYHSNYMVWSNIFAWDLLIYKGQEDVSSEDKEMHFHLLMLVDEQYPVIVYHSYHWLEFLVYQSWKNKGK